jgi:hypothetical protein
MVGDEGLRLYLCLDHSGQPASARVILSKRGARAVDFLAGTELAHLHSGATQLLTAFALEDLVQAGATGFDYAGANIPRVAHAKADWGGELTSFYAVRSPGIRSIVDATLRSLGALRQRSLEGLLPATLVRDDPAGLRGEATAALFPWPSEGLQPR